MTRRCARADFCAQLLTYRLERHTFCDSCWNFRSTRAKISKKFVTDAAASDKSSLRNKKLLKRNSSGWSPKNFSPTLIQYANSRLRWKILLGSDYPFITPDRCLADFARILIRDDVRPLIVKENAVKLLQLNENGA
jgi:hypothetical protein